MVLHLTEDPIKMMKNFHNMAEEGCILAVSVTGKEDLVDFNRFKSTAPKKEGASPGRKIRSSSHMCPRLKEVGDITGWELVEEWSQNTPMVWKSYG